MQTLKQNTHLILEHPTNTNTHHQGSIYPSPGIRSRWNLQNRLRSTQLKPRESQRAPPSITTKTATMSKRPYPSSWTSKNKLQNRKGSYEIFYNFLCSPEARIWRWAKPYSEGNWTMRVHEATMDKPWRKSSLTKNSTSSSVHNIFHPSPI
jgi:hypothetical protein